MTHFGSQGAPQTVNHFIQYIVDNFIDARKMTSAERYHKVGDKECQAKISVGNPILFTERTKRENVLTNMPLGFLSRETG